MQKRWKIIKRKRKKTKLNITLLLNLLKDKFVQLVSEYLFSLILNVCISIYNHTILYLNINIFKFLQLIYEFYINYFYYVFLYLQVKIFDSKDINLSKKPALPKIVLNANIKVDNKYSKILPYICIGNGENIGKKYDFM